MRTQRPVAVYDANVLFSSTLRDFFVRLALARAVHARWSDDIQDEWTRNLKKKRPNISADRIDTTRRLMEEVLPESLVRRKDYEFLLPDLSALKWPDPGDIHVVAAAKAIEATFIVTFNLKHFPLKNLTKFGILAIHPDDFVLHLLGLDHKKVLDVLKRQRATFVKPPQTVEELVARLMAKNDLKKSGAKILEYLQMESS